MNSLSHLTHQARLAYLRVRHPVLRQSTPCPACQGEAHFLDAVDLSKSCMEAAGIFQPSAGVPVYYYLCRRCGFCFAPQFHTWTFADFEQKIYNSDYVTVDPDYLQKRPNGNAAWVDKLLGQSKSQIRHLDYGGGSGLLSATMQKAGWNSRSYDPFVDRELKVMDLGGFDLVIVFEVFEHVPDITVLIADLGRLCKRDGLILFSTLLSDGQIASGYPLTWWYASPRNGHISLFSRASLAACLVREGFSLAHFSSGMHMAFRQMPQWASHLMHTH